jgi:hypothetical protein
MIVAPKLSLRFNIVMFEQRSFRPGDVTSDIEQVFEMKSTLRPKQHEHLELYQLLSDDWFSQPTTMFQRLGLSFYTARGFDVWQSCEHSRPEILTCRCLCPWNRLVTITVKAHGHEQSSVCELVGAFHLKASYL